MLIKNNLVDEYYINHLAYKKRDEYQQKDLNEKLIKIKNWNAQINEIILQNPVYARESTLEISFIKNIFCDVFGHTIMGDKNIFTIIPKDRNSSNNIPDYKIGKFNFQNSEKLLRPTGLVELKKPICINFRASLSNKGESRKTPVLQLISDLFDESDKCQFGVLSNMTLFEIFSRKYADKKSLLLDISKINNDHDVTILLALFDAKNSVIINPALLDDKISIDVISSESMTEDFYIKFKNVRDSIFKDEIYKKDIDEKFEFIINKILAQMIFILYAETCNFIPKNKLNNLLSSAHNKNKAYIEWCKALNIGSEILNIFGYNGGLFNLSFEEENFIKKLNENIFNYSMKLLSFSFINKENNAIDSEKMREILGQVLEYALIDKQNRLSGREKQSMKSEKQKKGVYYTKSFITSYIIKESINNNQYHSINSLWLDPACGSGAFLIEIYNQLNDYEKKGLIGLSDDKNVVQKIIDTYEDELIKRIHGIDNDKLATTLCQLNMSLKCSNPYKKLPILSNFVDFCDSLTGYNKNIKYDYIVANPPYLQWRYLPEEYREKLKNIDDYKLIAESGVDFSAFFFKFAFNHVSEGGIVSFIAPNKLLSSFQCRDFRNWMKENFDLIKLLDFRSDRVFDYTDIETCVYILKKKLSKKSKQDYLVVNEYLRNDNHIQEKSVFTVSKSLIDKLPYSVIPSKCNQDIIDIFNWIHENKTLKKIEDIFECKTGLGISNIDYLNSRPPKEHEKIYTPFIDGSCLSYEKETILTNQISKWVNINTSSIKNWKKIIPKSNWYCLVKELSTKPVGIITENIPIITNAILILCPKNNCDISKNNFIEYFKSPFTVAWFEFCFGSNRTHSNLRWKDCYISKIPIFNTENPIENIPPEIMNKCLRFIEMVKKKNINEKIRLVSKKKLLKSA